MTSLVRNSKLLFLAMIPLYLLISCSNKKQIEPNLCVTIEPQKYFLEQIVKDKYTVSALIREGSNPESFDPTPSQMLTLSNSLAYFKIGFLGIENNLIEKIKDQSNLNIVDCSAGIEIISDDHAHHHDDHHYHAHMGGDPHYWSSINSAKVILKNMLDAMLVIDKENEAFYRTNYQVELNKINKTDEFIKETLENSNNKAFIIYHPALSYFAKEYNLTQLSIENEGKNPSPAQLMQLINRANELNVKAVFIQQEFDIKNAEVIANQLGAESYSINLLSYNWHDEMTKIAQAIAKEDE